MKKTRKDALQEKILDYVRKTYGLTHSRRVRIGLIAKDCTIHGVTISKDGKRIDAKKLIKLKPAGFDHFSRID